MLPKEEGTCFESIQRYYFDRTKLMCAPLEYSGCGGLINFYFFLSKSISKILLNRK
jgi:hypothetical protein